MPAGAAGTGGTMPAVEGEPAPEDWAAYAARGLERVYRWNPDKETLERLTWREAWTALKAPVDMAGGTVQVHPGAGTLVLEGNRAAWWLPLAALPFQAVKAQAR
jgi:hypothetical protein